MNQYKNNKMYYKDGFHSEQSFKKDRHEIDIEYFEYLFNMQYLEGYHIGEDDRGFPIIVHKEKTLDDEKNFLRDYRVHECFPIINRGPLWYSTLSEAEKNELLEWYQKWLDVTDTLLKPEKLWWL